MHDLMIWECSGTWVVADDYSSVE